MKYVATILFAVLVAFFVYSEVVVAAPEAEADPIFFGFGGGRGYGHRHGGYGGGYGRGYGHRGFYG